MKYLQPDSPLPLDRNCKAFDGDFDAYRDEVLARLEDGSIVEVEGRRVGGPAAGESKAAVRKDMLLF